MRRIIGVSATLALSVLLAENATADQCPTKNELQKGITVTQTDGYKEIYSATADNIVTVLGYQDPAEKSQSLLSQGIYLVQTIDVTNDELVPSTRRTYTYPLSPGSMPVPKANGSWTAQVVVTSSDGIDTENHVMRFLDQTTMTFGACSYDMIPVEITYGEGEGETLLYLPELGFAVVGVWRSGGVDEVLSYAEIEAVR